MNLPKFYVGQKVVAITDHGRLIFRKGDVFTVTGIYPSFCKCWSLLITIGIPHTAMRKKCRQCNKIVAVETIEWTFPAEKFEPIIEDFQAITFEKVIEKELASVN